MKAYVDVQESELGKGGVSSELEALKELSERVEAVGPEEKDVINKTQPEAELPKSGMIGTGRGHGSSLDLDVMLGVKGEQL